MTLPSHIEHCLMIDYKRNPEIPAIYRRVYFGHETCEKRLPTCDELNDLLKIVDARGLHLTFVTPFLTEKGMEKVQLFLNQLQPLHLNAFEIVTSDWGLLWWIIQNKAGKPVISRFLTGQHVDFRLWDDTGQSTEHIVFLQGTYRKLTFKSRTSEMMNHLSSCTLLKEKTMEMFRRLGVTRFELSPVFQPMTIPDNPTLQYTLHVPFVPLTMFRTCPQQGNINRPKNRCNGDTCRHIRQKWQSVSMNRDLYCINNALYYDHPDIDPSSIAPIDRMVYHV